MALKTARAMVQTGVERIEPRELPLPEIGEDDALLAVEACGICGSDVESFQGVIKVPLPLIPG
ncbi:MAG: alcohol dehydrogenase, partial [Proteobacteria bacterium]